MVRWRSPLAIGIATTAAVACARGNPRFELGGGSGPQATETADPASSSSRGVTGAPPTGGRGDSEADSDAGDDPVDSPRLDLGSDTGPGESVQCPSVFAAVNGTKDLIIVDTTSGFAAIAGELLEPSAAIATRRDGLVVSFSAVDPQLATAIDPGLGRSRIIPLGGDPIDTLVVAAGFDGGDTLVFATQDGDILQGEVGMTLVASAFDNPSFPIGGDHTLQGDVHLFAGFDGTVALADPTLTDIEREHTFFRTSFTGAAIDSEGRLWVSGAQQLLYLLDINGPELGVDMVVPTMGVLQDLAPIILPAEQCPTDIFDFP